MQSEEIKNRKGGALMFVSKFYYFYFSMGCSSFVRAEK